MWSWVALLLLVVIAAIGFLVWRQWFETYHLARVDPGKLYRDGNRGLRELRNMLRSVRPRTVVSLVDDDEAVDRAKSQFADEERHLRATGGIGFERIPVVLGGWPDDAALSRFLSIASDAARQPVVVHCAQGVRRTGMMVAAYQMSVLGWSKDQARAQLLAFGHSMRTVGDVQRFIDVYDPDRRCMTESLPRSNE